jgi:hypothetical protein
MRLFKRADRVLKTMSHEPPLFQVCRYRFFPGAFLSLSVSLA